MICHRARAGVAIITMVMDKRGRWCFRWNGRWTLLANLDRRTRPLRTAAGRDPRPFIATIEKFANEGGMLTEQLWDAPDLPEAHMKFGCPTGAAMPLCWSHAEYIALVRSCHDGVCIDCVGPAFQRYVLHPVPSKYEIWTLRYPARRVSRGKILRIILAHRQQSSGQPMAERAAICWTRFMRQTGPLVCRFSDRRLAGRFMLLTFTFFWKADQHWEGRDWQINASRKVILTTG